MFCSHHRVVGYGYMQLYMKILNTRKVVVRNPRIKSQFEKHHVKGVLEEGELIIECL